MGLTNFPNGIEAPTLHNAVRKTADYTVVAVTDSGTTFYIDSDTAITFTLPAIVDGDSYTFVNLNASGKAALSVSPNASDGIHYAATEVDDKDVINTAATSVKGDYITIGTVNGSATAGYWNVTAVSGTWAKEA